MHIFFLNVNLPRKVCMIEYSRKWVTLEIGWGRGAGRFNDAFVAGLTRLVGFAMCYCVSFSVLAYNHVIRLFSVQSIKSLRTLEALGERIGVSNVKVTAYRYVLCDKDHLRMRHRQWPFVPQAPMLWSKCDICWCTWSFFKWFGCVDVQLEFLLI